ncbi:hypothetical protein GLE_0339 [Lysobacter enzymogenes]|uniref:Uncharacterized protein n=1 Tax=Lysobacter enzymogenes TaxID=69 RepID=A0A0S2DB83_LYSEN|nr:hypothetical protein GLE_0339 [Lysobacter enzymogenes]
MRHGSPPERCVLWPRAHCRRAASAAASGPRSGRMLGMPYGLQRVLHTYSWDAVAFMSQFRPRLRHEYVCRRGGRRGRRQ